MLILANNQTSPDHAPGCPFTPVPSTTGDSAAPNSRVLTRLPVGGHIALHSEFQAAVKGVAGQISRSAKVPAYQKGSLLSTLMTLAEMAELGVYCPARPATLTDQFAAIRHAASRFTVHPGVPMEHVLDTRITKARLVAMSKRLREEDAFKGSRRCGLLMDVIKSTGPRHLEIGDDTKIDFFGSAESLHRRSHPLLALATVTTQEAGSGFYQLGKVAFVPVLSPHHLFPVVDDLDRQAVSEVFGLLRWLENKKNIRAVASRDGFQIGAGYCLDIRCGGKLLVVDLNPSPLGEPSPGSSVISISELGSVESLKKRIAVTIIKGGSGE